MADISLILFDLNGVLYRYDRDARIGHLAAELALSPAAIMDAIWDSGFEDLGDAGALDADAYLAGFGARLGCAVTEAVWVAAQQTALMPMAATLGLLTRLHQGVRCAVLTNNNFLVLRHFPALYPEVAALAGDRACVSAEFGARKPDPEVYRRCLGRLGVAPEQTLFVDDSAGNVAGACAAGLHGLVYSDAAGLDAALARLGVLV